MTISNNLCVIRERIAEAARRAGRNPEDVILVTASKGVGIERLREGLSAGIKIFGESKVQEAMPKLQALGKEAVWHFIGHLQSNKVKYVAGAFTLIQSVDSIELAEEINSRAEKMGLIQDILLEVNVSGEAAKYGIMPDQADSVMNKVSCLKNIALKGFMTIPPFSKDPEESRVYFRILREMRDNARKSGTCPEDCRELSMGMSGDFEVAIEEGATMVRIGTAIFGARVK